MRIEDDTIVLPEAIYLPLDLSNDPQVMIVQLQFDRPHRLFCLFSPLDTSFEVQWSLIASVPISLLFQMNAFDDLASTILTTQARKQALIVRRLNELNERQKLARRRFKVSSSSWFKLESGLRLRL